MIIQGKRVFIAGLFMPAQIEMEDGKITAVLPYGTKKPDADYGDAVISPGFIDIHTHGAFGFDADSADPDGLAHWLQKLPEEGVTGVLPSTTSQADDVTVKALANIADVRDSDPRGAHILGAHTEGPMLDETYRGAHAPEKLRRPGIELFDKYQLAARGCIKYITIAVEHDRDFALTRYASAKGVTVSIGHTGASMNTALLAVAAGAGSFTHSFNAMTGLHHRTPGVVGALMACNAFAEVIADGDHVLPNIINILFKARGNRMILVSDSLVTKGVPPGRYGQGALTIDVDEHGTARLAGTSTLAGSALFINRGIELLVKQAMVSMENALLAATLYPAQALGLDHVKGRIRVGCDADITVLADDFSVVQTYCRGAAMLDT